MRCVNEGGSCLNAVRQDETFCDLSPASLDVPFKNLLPVSIKSYSQKSYLYTSDTELSVAPSNKLT